MMNIITPSRVKFKYGLILSLCACVAVTACGTSKTPAPVKNYGLQGGATSAGVHTVSGGETLWNIAQRYRIDMKDVIYVNNLHAPYDLAVGERLSLPPPATYKVRTGDTLYDISRVFSVSTTEIARLNKMSAPYRIQAGQDLRLPAIRPAYRENPKIQMASNIATPGTKPDMPPVASRPVEKVTKQLPIKTKTPPRAGSKFIWPVDGRIVSSYGPKKDGLHNDGINIKAPKGAPVRAAENGVVVYANNQLKGFGNLVLIRHDDRWMTAYGHMDKIMVKRGQKVGRGESIGLVGKTGSVDSPQLHFETRRGTKALNPELYLVRQGS